MEDEFVKKRPVKVTAKVTFIGELQIFRRNTKPDFSKRLVSLNTEDGQVMFCEIRNSKIPLINPIKIGDVVNVDIIFAGSEKNDKRYNNLYIVNLELI